MTPDREAELRLPTHRCCYYCFGSPSNARCRECGNSQPPSDELLEALDAIATLRAERDAARDAFEKARRFLCCDFDGEWKGRQA